MKTDLTPPISQTGRGVRRASLLAWIRLARVFQKLDRRSEEQLRTRSLSSAQFDVLAQVRSADGPTQQELADSLLVTKGNICQLLDRMERTSLLERRQEGRANRLYLTDRGRKLFADAVPEHEDLIDGLFSGLTPDERSQLLALLRKLDRSLS